jgi:peptidyl-prolyl cis-trans isomerase SurA
VQDGVRVLMLCGRDDPKAGGGPTFEEGHGASSRNERINKPRPAYLRDLRRDAVIDYN